MSISNKIKGAGLGVVGVALAATVFVVPVILLFGAAWISTTVSPWFMPIFEWSLAVCAIVLLPAALFQATRGFSAVGFFAASYIFGAILWACSLLLTLDLWGMIGVVIGLLVAGIGIVPVAFLAAIFHGEWTSVGDLAIMLVATFGTRFLGIWIGTKADSERRYVEPH